MNGIEQRLTSLLRERAELARPVEQLESVTSGSPRVVQPRADVRSPWRWVAVAAAAALIVVGLVALGRRTDSPAQSGGGSGAAFSFVTPYVSLTADDFFIDVGGRRFTSVGAKVELNSDPGDATYETLELEWTEHSLPMRMNIYFHADGTQWWSDEVRTYNGLADVAGDWVTFKGDFFRSSLGAAATGTFDQTATENGVTSHLHIAGLTLRTFLSAPPDHGCASTDTAPSSSTAVSSSTGAPSPSSVPCLTPSTLAREYVPSPGNQMLSTSTVPTTQALVAGGVSSLGLFPLADGVSAEVGLSGAQDICLLQRSVLISCVPLERTPSPAQIVPMGYDALGRQVIWGVIQQGFSAVLVAADGTETLAARSRRNANGLYGFGVLRLDIATKAKIVIRDANGNAVQTTDLTP